MPFGDDLATILGNRTTPPPGVAMGQEMTSILSALAQAKMQQQGAAALQAQTQAGAERLQPPRLQSEEKVAQIGAASRQDISAMADRAKIAPDVDWDNPEAAARWQTYLTTGNTTGLPTKAKPAKVPKADAKAAAQQQLITDALNGISELKSKVGGLATGMVGQGAQSVEALLGHGQKAEYQKSLAANSANIYKAMKDMNIPAKDAEGFKKWLSDPSKLDEAEQLLIKKQQGGAYGAGGTKPQIKTGTVIRSPDGNTHRWTGTAWNPPLPPQAAKQ